MIPTKRSDCLQRSFRVVAVFVAMNFVRVELAANTCLVVGTHMGNSDPNLRFSGFGAQTGDRGWRHM